MKHLIPTDDPDFVLPERGGWEAYFDSSTTRSKIVERNAEKHGIRVEKWQN